MGIAVTLFVVACAALNPLALALSPLALLWITTYSYTKRWTHWSHLWLGSALAIAPAGGYIAITGAWSEPWYALLVIALAVTGWVAGFDMLYALQDEAFDRQRGLKSAVVLLGESRSILLAKALHGIAIAALAGYGLVAGFGPIYFASVGVAAVIIAWEHQLVRPGDLSRLNAAFFTMNGIVSIVVFIGALGDRLL